MDEFKPVVFKVGTQKFGVDINMVQGIEKEQNIVPVPNSAQYFKGIINLRGVVIPVYSLKRKFQFNEDGNNNSQYIIVRIKGHFMALEVDGVEEIHNVMDEHLHTVPVIIGNKDTSYFESVINDGENLIIIIDIDKLLTDDELDIVDKMVKNQ